MFLVLQFLVLVCLLCFLKLLFNSREVISVIVSLEFAWFSLSFLSLVVVLWLNKVSYLIVFFIVIVLSAGELALVLTLLGLTRGV